MTGRVGCALAAMATIKRLPATAVNRRDFLTFSTPLLSEMVFLEPGGPKVAGRFAPTGAVGRPKKLVFGAVFCLQRPFG
jgi:hypothetical protein